MTATKTKTKPSGPAELARLEQERLRVNARRSRTREELDRLAGLHDRHGRGRRGGELGELERRINAAKAAGIRTGDDESPEIVALETERALKLARVRELQAELWRCQEAEKAVAGDRLNALIRHHEEFAALTDAEAERGAELLAALQAAARAVVTHRGVVSKAASLALGGLGRDEQSKLSRRWAPWTGPARPASQAMFAAVEALAAGTFSSPGSATTFEIGDSSSVVAAAMRSDEHEISDAPEELAAMAVEAAVN